VIGAGKKIAVICAGLYRISAAIRFVVIYPAAGLGGHVTRQKTPASINRRRIMRSPPVDSRASPATSPPCFCVTRSGPSPIRWSYLATHAWRPGPAVSFQASAPSRVDRSPGALQRLAGRARSRLSPLPPPGWPALLRTAARPHGLAAVLLRAMRMFGRDSFDLRAAAPASATVIDSLAPRIPGISIPPWAPIFACLFYPDNLPHAGQLPLVSGLARICRRGRPPSTGPARRLRLPSPSGPFRVLTDRRPVPGRLHRRSC